jgi:hypothetical protein
VRARVHVRESNLDLLFEILRLGRLILHYRHSHFLRTWPHHQTNVTSLTYTVLN